MKMVNDRFVFKLWTVLQERMIFKFQKLFPLKLNIKDKAFMAWFIVYIYVLLVKCLNVRTKSDLYIIVSLSLHFSRAAIKFCICAFMYNFLYNSHLVHTLFIYQFRYTSKYKTRNNKWILTSYGFPVRE